ncbi:MAG: hypothetical protein O2820_06335 [Planctomycetota bacterium]|nr:hypothetical protein [Planctomycetota bacterium]MDA1248825.1 hypothetical protein [Planctomycetota bacterium]
MLMLRPFAASLAVIATLFSTVQAIADGPLDLIPSDAAIVVRLKSPEGTIAKVGNFANQIQPGIGFLVQGQAPALGIAISNPTLGGVDLKNDWYVAAFPKKDGEPDVVFVVPSTDSDAMKEAVGPGFTYAVKGDWVAYSMNPAATKKSQACIDGKAKSLNLGRRAGGLFNENDISIFVNIATLTGAYAEELDKAEDELARGLENFDESQAPPGVNAKALREMIQTFGKTALQAVRDADAFAAGVTFGEEALTIDELLLVKAGSDSSKFLAANPGSELALLGKVPQGELGYVALDMDMSGFIKWGLGLAVSIMDGNEDAAKQLEIVSKSLEEVKFGSVVTAFGLNTEGDDGILRTVSVTEATPASKLRSLVRDFSKLGAISSPGIKQEITVKEDAETYGKHKADLVTVKQEFSPEADPLGISQQMMDLFYGKEGATQRVVSTDSLMIQTAGGGQDTMKATLASLEGPAATSGAVVDARKLALGKSNLVAMIDLPNFLLKGAVAAGKSGMLPIPLPTEEIAKIKIPVSYLVISVGTEPDGLRAKTALPIKMFKGFMEIQKFVQQMQQNQLQNGF